MSARTIDRPVFKDRHFLKNIIIFIIKLEVFLLPLFFLPFTFEIFEFAKQNLLWSLTGLATLLWLINVLLIEKKIIYKRTPLDLPIVIYLIITGLSTLLSIDRFSSFFGYYGRFSDAYLTSLFLALLYFLIINLFSEKQLKKTLHLLLWSLGVSLSISILAMVGILSRLFAGLSSMMILQSPSFSPSGGSVELLSLTAAIALVMSAAFYSYNFKEAGLSKKKRAGFYALAIISLVVLILTNVTIAWIAALIGLAAVFGYAFFATHHNLDVGNKNEMCLAPALVLFIICMIFLAIAGNFSFYQRIFKDSLPREVFLNNDESTVVAWRSFKKNPIFGSGPGTFAYDFSLHRAAEFNNNQFWQLRFDRASNQIIELISTIGILGIVSYLAVIGIFLFAGLIFLKNIFRNVEEDGVVAIAGFFSVLIIFVLQMLYFDSLVLRFIFWLSLALSVASWRNIFAKIFVNKEIDLSKYKDFKPIFISGVILASIFFASMSYAQAKHYVADVYYNNFRLTGDQESLKRAVELNHQRMNYHLLLSRDYINEVRSDIELLSSSEAEVDSQRKEKLQNNIQLALAEAKLAVEFSPNSVMVWENLGSIYRDIKMIAMGSLDPAIDSFKKAVELESSNPVLLTELAKLYLINNQTNEAASLFQRAIGQKANYLEAHVGLAKTYDALGQTDKAIIILEQLSQNIKNPELVYENGRLYYNQGDINNAIEKFKQAIVLRPNYANAIYSLGLAYQRAGNNELALEQFNKVLEFNPENEGVKKIIEDLEKSKPSEEKED